MPDGAAQQARPAPLIDKAVIVGVGLIGGSFALALRRAGMVRELIGVGRSQATLAEALRLGLVDAVAEDLSVATAADLVLLAVPVAQTGAVLEALRPWLGARTVVTDAGSTKQDVVTAARDALGEAMPRFVAAHPIAGAEHSGPAAARVELFQGRKVILTPLPETEPSAVALVRAAWDACGADVRQMSPSRHDAIFAAVSHLPHVLSFALVHELANRPDADTYFDYAASGFRDFTRIASSHPEMWRDICLANREALLAELDRYQAELGRLCALLEAGDAAGLEAMFTLARSRRNAWLNPRD